MGRPWNGGKSNQRSTGSSSAVTAVLFSRGNSTLHQETKQGSYIYSGEAGNFHEWEFRTKLRSRGKRGDHYVDAVSRITEGLRGDAFIVAQEVGLESLWQEEVAAVEGDLETSVEDRVPSGIERLVEAMREHVFPLTTHEARELFRQYTKQSGALSRQSGESMTQYVSRRQRCWKLLKELDPDIELSEGHRADMLLELAGLDRNERIMVQASVNNARTFDQIAEALILQHPRIHLKETKKTNAGKGTGSTKGKGKGFFRRKFKFQGKGFKNTANIADEWYEDPDALDQGSWEDRYDEGDNDDDDDGDPASAYIAGSDDEEEEEVYEDEEEVDIEDPVEASELLSIAFLADSEGYLDHLDQDAEGAASYIQESTTAFMAFGKGKKKGSSKGRKGYPVRASTLTIEDRKSKLKALKARTNCKDCGRRGHWRGDPGCTMKKDSAGSQTAQKHRSVRFSLNLSGAYSHGAEDRRLVRDAGDDKFAGVAAKSKASADVPPPPVPVATRRAAATRTVPVAKASSSTGSSGSEPSFTVGVFAGTSFRDVHEKYLAQYIKMKAAIEKGKGPLPPEQQMFVSWVDENSGSVAGYPGADNCTHDRVSNKGSSARYKRFTCLNPNCGISWNEERDLPTEDPDICPHLRVDHRGSSKGQLRTYCKDCGTVIDIADRGAAREVEAEARNPTMTVEEAALLERVINGESVYKPEILHALNAMTEAVGTLNQNEEYSLKSVADAFLDHMDRAREALRNPQGSTAFACIKVSSSQAWADVSDVDSNSSGPPPMVSSSGSQRSTPQGSDSDSSGPDLVSSPETSEEEVDYREAARRELKRLEARRSAKLERQQKELAKKSREIEEKLARQSCSSCSSSSKEHTRTAGDCETGAVPAQSNQVRTSYTNTKLKPDKQATTHRVVDPLTDEHVWVVVDEGANSCCHGDEWRRNAEDKIYKLGFRFHPEHFRTTQFKGIGNRNSKGLWNVPLGFKLRDNNDIYQGACQSHELANCNFPLLLSQSVQAHMHFVKDMAKGTIMLGDTGEYLEVVRQAGTGLFMIRIDHLAINHFANDIGDEELAMNMTLPQPVLDELERQFLIDSAEAIAERERKEAEQGPVIENAWTYAGCSVDDPSPRAWMTTEQPLTQEETNKLARSDIVLATCGALNFEDSDYSFCQDRKSFQRMIHHQQGDNSTHYSLNHVPTRQAFTTEFGKHFPYLTQGRHIILINCNHLRDPNEQERLTNHIGLHPSTLLQTARHDELEELLRDLAAVRAHPEKKWLIIFVCRKGTHRSVAASELADVLINRYIYREVDAIEDRILSRAAGEDSQSRNTIRFHLSRNAWDHTCKGYDDKRSRGRTQECKYCQIKVPNALGQFRQAMKIASKKAIIGDKGAGFMRMKDEPEVDLFSESDWDHDSEEEKEQESKRQDSRQGASPEEQKGKGTSGGFPALGKGKTKTQDNPEGGKSAAGKQEETQQETKGGKGKGQSSNEAGWYAREVDPEEVKHLKPPDPEENIWRQLDREQQADRQRAKAEKLAKEAAEEAERQKSRGKGETRWARPRDPYDFSRKQYSTPPPWKQSSQAQTQAGKGKGSKAPKRPTSPSPPIDQQNYPPVERPSRKTLAERRKLPPHLQGEGKGRKAASSSGTVPVRSRTAALKEEVTATYGEYALKTVLQNLAKVFDPKGERRRKRDTSPMDQISDIVIDKDLDWTMIQAMLENALDEENACRSDQSLSSRGRSERRRRLTKQREKRSSSSEERGKKSKYHGNPREQYQDRSRSRYESKTKRPTKKKQSSSSSGADAESVSSSSYPDFNDTAAKRGEEQDVPDTNADDGQDEPDFDADVLICGACGQEVEIRGEERGKTWIQARDGTYVHVNCWSTNPEKWKDRIDQSVLDKLGYEPSVKWTCFNCNVELSRERDVSCPQCHMKQKHSDKAWLEEWGGPEKPDTGTKKDDEEEDVAPGSLGVGNEPDEDQELTFNKDRAFQEAIDAGRWKYEFDPAKLNADDLDTIFDIEEARGKYKSHRTYIGPDSTSKESNLSIANKPDHEKVGYHRTGEDKIAVEVRYNNQDNKVTYHGAMSNYQKTTFARYVGKEWILVSRHDDIKANIALKDRRDQKPERTLIFIHPPMEPAPPASQGPTGWGSVGVANIAIQEHPPVAFICQSPEFFEADDISVPEYHLAEKLGYTGFKAAQGNTLFQRSTKAKGSH
jgi:hypothetical protein